MTVNVVFLHKIELQMLQILFFKKGNNLFCLQTVEPAHASKYVPHNEYMLNNLQSMLSVCLILLLTISTYFIFRYHPVLRIRIWDPVPF